MRELKFRIWNILEGKWNGIHIKEPKMVGGTCCKEGIYIIPESTSRNLVVQQYTGLKDKNNREIYEGDIIKGVCLTYGDSVAVVGLDTFGIFYTNVDYYPTEPYLHCFCMMQEHNEVIGNIFENPELLK